MLFFLSFFHCCFLFSFLRCIRTQLFFVREKGSARGRGERQREREREEEEKGEKEVVARLPADRRLSSSPPFTDTPPPSAPRRSRTTRGRSPSGPGTCPGRWTAASTR